MRRATSSLALRALRHPALVDRQRDDRGAVLARERQYGVDLRPSRLEMNRVEDRPSGIVLQRGFEDFGLGRIDRQRRFDRLREPPHDLAHLHFFVGSLGERAADVEHVRAALDLLARDERDIVVALLEQEALEPARALRVDALAHDQRRGLLFERDRRYRRGDLFAGLRLQSPRLARDAVDRGAQRGDVRGRRAAASADDVDAEIAKRKRRARARALRALPDRSSRRCGPISGSPALGMTLTNARERSHKITNRVAHLRRPRRAVQADDFDVERVEHRANRANVGAEQHAAFGDQRRLRLNRHAPHAARELAADSGDRRLELQQVLHRLEQEQIDAALDERASLFGVNVAQLLEGDVRERRIGGRDEHAGRAHRSRDETRTLAASKTPRRLRARARRRAG